MGSYAADVATVVLFVLVPHQIVSLKDGDKFLTEDAVPAKKSEWRNLMAINLVTLVMQFLTPDMIGRIAGALGLDRGATQTALGGAVPGLLAGLSNVVAQPGGARKLADTTAA
jgi:hypothetical protein